jgi:hypothetical protein
MARWVRAVRKRNGLANFLWAFLLGSLNCVECRKFQFWGLNCNLNGTFRGLKSIFLQSKDQLINARCLSWKWKLKLNSVAWVREGTIPTERAPLVGEVSASFCGYRLPRGLHDGSLRPYSRFPRPEPLLSLQVAPQLYSRGRMGLVPDPLLLRKCGSAGNRNRTSRSVAKNSDH